MDASGLQAAAHARDVAARRALARALAHRRRIAAGDQAIQAIDATYRLRVRSGILKLHRRKYDHRRKRRVDAYSHLGDRLDAQTMWARWAAGVDALARVREIDPQFPALTAVPVPGSVWEVADEGRLLAARDEHRAICAERLPRLLTRLRADNDQALANARAEHARVRAQRPFWARPAQTLHGILTDVELHLGALDQLADHTRPERALDRLDTWGRLRDAATRLCADETLGLPDWAQLRAVRDAWMFDDAEGLDALRAKLHAWALVRGLRQAPRQDLASVVLARREPGRAIVAA